MLGLQRRATDDRARSYGTAANSRASSQQALLGEWLLLESHRTHPVQLGWVRGHTTRTAIPYLAQQWCDAAAPKEANNEHDPRHISVHDGRFVLTDSQGYTFKKARRQQ